MLEFLILVGSLLLSVLIVTPFAGALVRFRANYNPKGLQLDNDGDVQPYTGPVVSSYFGMLKRVYRIEGWAGLYKGFMPTLISAAGISIFMLVVFQVNEPRHGRYDAPRVGVLGTLVYSILSMLISLPAVIITDRAITTPHKLPFFKPMHSLRILLTPTERRRPWILYLTPGLLASEVLHIAYVVLGLHTLRKLLLPELSDSRIPRVEDVSPIKLGIYFAIAILSTAILTPLEVIGTRLAIQRNHAAPEYNSVTQEIDGDAEEPADYFGAEEDVIGLRSEGDPYLGLVDCGKRIINEEGIRALYRAWWLTMLAGLAGAFS